MDIHEPTKKNYKNGLKMINFPFKKTIKRFVAFARLSRTTYSLKRVVFLRKIKKKNKINVVFLAANLSMWRYQHLLELFQEHERFNVFVVLAPFLCYQKDEQLKNMTELKQYFDSKGISYYESNACDIVSDIKPDILFYPQYYFNCMPPECDAKKFKDRLLCAYPYAFNSIYDSFAYNDEFHNAAWKLFYPSASMLKEARQLAFNKGRNVVVTGYPNADDFLSDKTKDVWKKQRQNKKRIIWASHFTIERGCSPLFFSNFLKFSNFMQEIAKKYSGKIQFAFKPHPRLLTELYKHKDWGKQKTDEYYKWWEEQENTQLETGEFINLFKTSDAMIHDCGSFSIEYFYTKKPVMFLSRDMEEIKKNKNEVGKIALDTHYVGKENDDIIDFIEEVVLNGNDPMKKQREDFFAKYLLPPNGKTVAQNTMDDILNSLEMQ